MSLPPDRAPPEAGEAGEPPEEGAHPDGVDGELGPPTLHPPTCLLRVSAGTRQTTLSRVLLMVLPVLGLSLIGIPVTQKDSDTLISPMLPVLRRL
eukprot:sb/3479274/